VLDYIMQTKEVDKVLSLFSRIFDLRIAFFDTMDRELFMFDVKQRSSYCKAVRGIEGLCRLCEKSDLSHLHAAKRTKRIIVYHCHRGLFEAIVPLIDYNGEYLGSLMFGQLQDSQKPTPSQPTAYLYDEYLKLPAITNKRAREVAVLLKHVSQSIIENEWLKRVREDWAETLNEYIDANIKNHITIDMLAKISNCSVSSITHRFSDYFGSPPIKFITIKKLEAAKKMMLSGMKIYEVAQEFGFYDQYHFSKVFRKHFGYSPSRYIRENRKSGPTPSL